MTLPQLIESTRNAYDTKHGAGKFTSEYGKHPSFSDTMEVASELLKGQTAASAPSAPPIPSAPRPTLPDPTAAEAAAHRATLAALTAELEKMAPGALSRAQATTTTSAPDPKEAQLHGLARYAAGVRRQLGIK